MFLGLFVIKYLNFCGPFPKSKHFAKHNIACRWFYYENVDCGIKYEIVNSQDKEMKTISNSVNSITNDVLLEQDVL